MTGHRNRRTRTLSLRRICLLGLALPALVGGCAATADPVALETPPTAMQSDSLDADIAGLEVRHGTRIGVTAIDPSSGKTFHHRADEPFAMCSTFKTYATAEVLRRTAAGTASLEESIAIEPGDLVEDSPVTSAAVGTSMTVRQLAEAALTRSDNTAGNQLLERIGGPAAVTALARDIGDHSTRLDRWEPELNAALRGDPRDTSTTRELADGYRALLLGDALAPVERAQLVDWLRASTTSDKRIRAGLPTGWTAADKTGAGRFGTVNDVGVVWDPAGRPLVLAVLTDSLSNREDAPRNNQVIADTTAAVIRALRG